MPSPVSWKGWRNTSFSGIPSSRPALRTSSLKRLRSGSMISLEIYVVRKSAYIVVGLDNRGFSTQSAFYNIGIDSSLCQKVYSTNLLCFFFKYTNELFTNNLTLALRFCNSCKLVIISLLRIDTDKVQVELTLVAKYSLYLITFIFTQ